MPANWPVLDWRRRRTTAEIKHRFEEQRALRGLEPAAEPLRNASA
jgi:hypothetical protein